MLEVAKGLIRVHDVVDLEVVVHEADAEPAAELDDHFAADAGHVACCGRHDGSLLDDQEVDPLVSVTLPSRSSSMPPRRG